MREVAIIAFAQTPNRRRELHRDEAEMLAPVVADALGQVGLSRKEVGFTCSVFGLVGLPRRAAVLLCTGPRRAGRRLPVLCDVGRGRREAVTTSSGATPNRPLFGQGERGMVIPRRGSTAIARREALC